MSHRISIICVKTLVIAVVALSLAQTAQAGVVYSFASGDWSYGGTWAGSIPPANDTTTDTAWLQNDNVVTVNAPRSVGQLMVTTAEVDFNADFDTGTEYAIPLSMIGGVAGPTEGIAVQDNNASVTFGKGVWVGVDDGGTGEYTLNSGTLNILNNWGFNYGLVLGVNSGSTGTFNQNGGSIYVDFMFGPAGIREGDGTAAFNFNGGEISLPGDRIGFADDWDWFTPTAPSGYVYTETYDSVEDRTLLHFTGGSLSGDLNSDGFVGGDDLDIVRSFWGQNVTAGDLLMGDPSGDGFVGGDDLDIVRANWGQGTPPAAASVPEPGAMILVFSAVLMLIWSYRR